MNSPQTRIAVVILNWNGRVFLDKFLRNVIKNSQPLARVVVADNGSTDDSVAWLKENFEEVEIIEFDQNYGFTGGYNRALQEVDAEFYILLNSDVKVTPNWIEPLLALFDSDPLVAAAQPKVLSYSSRDHFEYAGAAGGFIDVLGYPFCRGRLIGGCEKDQGQYDTTCEIFWATGAALMVRAQRFHDCGGFDDNFFAHQEEIDLCWRLKRQGFSILSSSESVVYHVGGGTLPAWSPFKTFLNFRNNIAMLYKNLSTPRFCIVYPIRVGTDGLRFLSYLIMAKFSFAAAVFRGHRDFWRMRSRLNRHPKFGFRPVGQVYRGSIVLYSVLVSKTFSKLKDRLR